MRTNLKVILAAMGIAVLTSPVMAGTLSNTHAPLSAELSTDNAFGRVQRDRHGSDGVHRSVSDCVRVAFPQCGASWRRARHIHRHHRE
jgi:cation transporter-like permease